MSVESVRHQIKNLRKTFESFARYPESPLTQSVRLQYINNNIQSLLDNHIYLGTLKTVKRVEAQAQQFVKELETKLGDIGLIRDDDAVSEAGRGWIVPEGGKLIAQDFSASMKAQPRQAKQIIGDEGVDKNRIEIVDVNMSDDDDDCVITMVIDKKRKAEDSATLEKEESRRPKRITGNNLIESKKDQDEVMDERQYNGNDDDLQVFGTEWETEGTRMEFSRSDELLWYQPTEHFDEDMLP